MGRIIQKGKCQLCGKKAKLDVHHIMPFWDDTINLCKPCHIKVEAMTKNFLIHGNFFNFDLLKKRQSEYYKRNSKIIVKYAKKYRKKNFSYKHIKLAKYIYMNICFNKKTGNVVLKFFVGSFHFKKDGKRVTRNVFIGGQRV